MDTEATRPPAIGADARLLAIVRTLSRELHGDTSGYVEPTLDADFERDLGFDSLARAELLGRIESEFACQLPLTAFTSAATPADMLRLLTGETRREHVRSKPTIPPPAGAPSTFRHATAELSIPRHAATLVEALHWHADEHGERTHIVLIEADGATESPISYGDLRERAMRAAGGLRSLGIDAGDTIALMLPTGPDFFVTFMAALLCGAVPVPIYPPLRASQLGEHVERYTTLLTNAQVKALVVFDAVKTVGRLLGARVPTLRHVLTPEHIPSLPFPAAVSVHADDVAMLQYTSGSTGLPKGVILAHANLMANIRAMGARIEVRPDDVLVSWLPLSHNMGLIAAWLAPLYFGIPLVIASPLAFLSRPETWLHMISRHRGTITAAPNFAYDRCARHLAAEALVGIDLSSLRLAVCGAEPVSPNTMRAFSDRMRLAGFDARAITSVYGLAENTLALTIPPPGRGLTVDKVSRASLSRERQAVPTQNDDSAIEVVSCGAVLAGSELRIVGGHGQALPERHIGKIEFRGASMTRGYYRNPDQSARLMDGEWADSGDLGYVAGGELFVTGRVKDMIIRGGRHFFPYELEDAVGRLSDAVLGGVAVCGAVDPERGTQRVVIFVETAQADAAARARLVERINATTIACFGAPAERVVLVAPGAIPKTPGGKIQHAAMIEQFERSEHEHRTLEETTATPPVWRQLSKAVGGSAKSLLRRAVRRTGSLDFGLWCWGLAVSIAFVVFCRVALSKNETRNWHAAARGARLFLRLAGLSPEVAGAPSSFPASASIVAANHTSYLDSIVLMAWLPHPAHFVAKRELADRLFVGHLLQRLGTRFVDRSNYRQSVEDEARLERSAGSETLVYFPEGTFGPAAGLGVFHLGAFRAACVAGRPVVPIALRGVRAVLRDGEWLPKRGPIELTVLPPIMPQGADMASIAKLRSEVRHAILAHCGEPEMIGAGPAGFSPPEASPSDS